MVGGLKVRPLGRWSISVFFALDFESRKRDLMVGSLKPRPYGWWSKSETLWLVV